MNNALATNSFEPGSLKELVGFAEWISASGLVPGHLRGKPRDIVMVALRGRELGLTLMQSMASIYLVDGKLSLSAELWIALAKRHPDCEYFTLLESTEDHATYECKRRGAVPVRLTYTLAQATKAGLTSKDVWKKHPGPMLRARCGGGLARAEFPDAGLGLLLHDEAEEITGQPVPVVEYRTSDAVGDSPVPQVILDDLEQFGGEPTIESAVDILLHHAPEMGQEDQAVSFDVLAKAAHQSTAAFKRAVLNALVGMVQTASSLFALDEVIANARKIVPPASAGYKAIAEAHMKRATELETPPPPNAPKPEDPEATDVGTLIAQTAAIEEWRVHAVSKQNEHELSASFLKREKEFKKIGIADACITITADLLKPMLNTDSRNVAIGFIRTRGQKAA